MYYFKLINKIAYVIHEETGTSLRYLRRGAAPEVPDYKAEYFQQWLLYTQKERRKMWTNSLACCPTAVPCMEQPKPSYIDIYNDLYGCKNKVKENTMGYNNASAQLVVQAAPPADPHEMTRDYLNSRVDSTYYAKRDIRGFYHMDETYPQTGQAMVDTILTGKYILHPKTASHDYDDSHIEWRDPATPADKEGYKAAMERLGAAKQKATDEITVLWPEEGLAALREFEAFDPTVAPTPTVH